MFSRQCPTCGSGVNERAVCSHCGTLVTAELEIARIRNEGSKFLHRQLDRLPKRIEPHHLIWVCALMPLIVLPPVFSLMYAIFMMRKGDKSLQSSNLDWLAILSALNIFFSIVLWAKFHFAGIELFTALFQSIKSFADALLSWLTFERPTAKVIPI